MSDFIDFKPNFTGDLVIPTDPDCLLSIARWAANAQRRPKFVAFVRTPSDVTLAIAFARANHLPTGGVGRCTLRTAGPNSTCLYIYRQCRAFAAEHL